MHIECCGNRCSFVDCNVVFGLEIGCQSNGILHQSWVVKRNDRNTVCYLEHLFIHDISRNMHVGHLVYCRQKNTYKLHLIAVSIFLWCVCTCIYMCFSMFLCLLQVRLYIKVTRPSGILALNAGWPCTFQKYLQICIWFC